MIESSLYPRSFPKHVWSSGQMGSKLWLAQELEKIVPPDQPQTIWILGGWCGLLAQIFFVRDRLSLAAVRSFDIDPGCESLADEMMNLWEWDNHRFKAFTVDVNSLDYERPERYYTAAPSIVINTSVEHFHSHDWWERIPQGTMVVLQSADMKHEEHVGDVDSEAGLAERFLVRERLFLGKLHFDYGNSTSFHRFMLIGRK